MNVGVTDAPSSRVTYAAIVARVVASFVGGYVFVWGFIAAGIAVLISLGMAFNDARNLTHLLAFLVFLIAVCWAFVCTSMSKVMLVLFGGGAAMTALSWLLIRSTG